MTYKDIAKQLCEGLDNDIKEVTKKLKEYAKVNNLTKQELNNMCWENSLKIFNEIY